MNINKLYIYIYIKKRIFIIILIIIYLIIKKQATYKNTPHCEIQFNILIPSISITMDAPINNNISYNIITISNNTLNNNIIIIIKSYNFE